MKIGVIGTGAIGGYYGGRLAQAGQDVHFLLRSDYHHVKSEGLQVDSINGNFIVKPINAYSNIEQMPKCDVVLVCIKTTDNAQLLKSLQTIVKPSTPIVAMQNGLTVEKTIKEAYPQNSVYGGICFIASQKTGPGYVQHLVAGGIKLGEFHPNLTIVPPSSELKKLASIFTASGIETGIRDNIILARWEKLVWNIPYNGLSVVLNTTTSPLMRNAETRQLVEHIMIEVVTAANASGYQIDHRFCAQLMMATDKMKDYAPSMKLDFLAHRPMEIDEIYRQPIEAARAVGVKVPKIEMLLQQLSFIQAHYPQQETDQQ